MKKIKLFIGWSVILLTSSCTTSKLLTSGVSPVEVKDLQKFQTFAYISLIESGNSGKFNDTISNKSKISFSETLETYRDKMPVTKKY